MNWKNLVLFFGLVSALSSCGTKKSSTLVSSPAAGTGGTTTDTTTDTTIDTTTDTATTPDQVVLTYVESPFESLSIQPTSIDKPDYFMVTFEHTKTPEQQIADETAFAARYNKESEGNHLFINQNLDFGKPNAQYNIYEYNVSTNEEFNEFKAKLLNDRNTKNAMVTITRVTSIAGQPVTTPFNKVTFLKLNFEKIENLNYAEVAARFSNPADATINLFELGDLSTFITKNIDDVIPFTPATADGYRGFVSNLTPVKI
ncbi:MAG: hypothetical protein QE271_06430 [Bacteriovoracaceae bacterium]|nr:hypothetical protein [Bacteriovoracaceae bacterium]